MSLFNAEYQRALATSNLPATARLILYVLAENASATGTDNPYSCQMRNHEIAAYSKLSTRTVTAHLNELEADGWIHWTRGNRYTPHRIVLIVAKPPTTTRYRVTTHNDRQGGA